MNGKKTVRCYSDDVDSDWRRRERIRLADIRDRLSPAERNALTIDIVNILRSEVSIDDGCVGFFWPMRSEVDLRSYITELLDIGIDAALPAIVEKNQPLEFWRWEASAELSDKGVWGIPTPAEKALVHPTMLLVPLLGFDSAGHRLGYGGGYYDRTLATLDPLPLTIGIGFESGRVSTIRPQDHDIAMDAIVTEHGIHWNKKKC